MFFQSSQQENEERGAVKLREDNIRMWMEKERQAREAIEARLDAGLQQEHLERDK